MCDGFCYDPSKLQYEIDKYELGGSLGHIVSFLCIPHFFKKLYVSEMYIFIVLFLAKLNSFNRYSGKLQSKEHLQVVNLDKQSK